jgi:hypothetical protein
MSQPEWLAEARNMLPRKSVLVQLGGTGLLRWRVTPYDVGFIAEAYVPPQRPT